MEICLGQEHDTQSPQMHEGSVSILELPHKFTNAYGLVEFNEVQSLETQCDSGKCSHPRT